VYVKEIYICDINMYITVMKRFSAHDTMSRDGNEVPNHEAARTLHVKTYSIDNSNNNNTRQAKRKRKRKKDLQFVLVLQQQQQHNNNGCRYFFSTDHGHDLVFLYCRGESLSSLFWKHGRRYYGSETFRLVVDHRHGLIVMVPVFSRTGMFCH